MLLRARAATEEDFTRRRKRRGFTAENAEDAERRVNSEQ
jgi:hypothetical protein